MFQVCSCWTHNWVRVMLQDVRLLRRSVPQLDLPGGPPPARVAMCDVRVGRSCPQLQDLLQPLPQITWVAPFFSVSCFRRRHALIHWWCWRSAWFQWCEPKSVAEGWSTSMRRIFMCTRRLLHTDGIHTMPSSASSFRCGVGLTGLRSRGCCGR